MPVAHGDIKPQNVLLRQGRPVLADLSEACMTAPGGGGVRGGPASELQLWEARCAAPAPGSL